MYEITMVCLILTLKFLLLNALTLEYHEHFLQIKMHITWGAWVTQSVKHLPSDDPGM